MNCSKNKEHELIEHHLNSHIGSEKSALRVLHGRGGCFEQLNFLNIDQFGSLIIVMLHENRDVSWQEILANEILRLDQIKGVVIQNRKVSPSTQVCFGEVPESCVLEEKGVSYELCPQSIKNPGWFLDMSEGRKWVRENSKQAKVLNLFAYTCGFSLMALEGGATKVLNMDMNSSVLKRGRRNHELNEFSKDCVSYYHHDVLKSFGKIKRLGLYDVIIVDPPSIQTGSFQLRRDYPKVLRRLPEWLSEKGKALLCCNDPKVTDCEFLDWISSSISIPHKSVRLNQPEDYPELNRERALKVFVLEKVNPTC